MTKKRIIIHLLIVLIVCGGILPRLRSAAASDNEHTIYEYLINSGFNTAAAVGILANIEKESSFNPNAQGDYVNGVATSYGICQWHNDRWTNLKNYRPNDWTTLNGQLAFLVHELEVSKKTINSYMRNSIPNTSDGAYEAGRYWCYYYEVPANRANVSVSRGNRARDYYWPRYYVPPVQNAYLDVNGVLNGTASGGLQDFGTCDVYINGSCVANDVNDYYTAWPAGTTYEIRDIRPAAQHTYSGSSSYSGTIGTAQVDINLAFDTYGTLTVNGWLDAAVSSDIGGYGTFDVYINGSADGTGLTSYSKKWPKGTTFEVRRPQPSDDHLYEGLAAGNLSGTLGTGTSTVTLSFTTKGHPTGEWTYTKKLPGNITSDDCDIEYQYTETRTAAASPGSGWVRQEGSETTKYENDGGVYDSDFELSTSNTRVYVGSYYYHYCGANTGVEVEHFNDGVHTDYHNAGDVNQFYVSAQYTDELDSRYQSYSIKWVSGQWADGLAYCSAGRSAIYYRRYQYQNKKAVTYYIWTKTSDWLTAPSGSGTPSQYRYRLKDHADPVIVTVKVTEITPTGFTVTCRASDDSGITKLAASSWTDTETEANAKVNEAVPASADNKVEISITIPVSDHNNEKDVYYNAKIKVFDKAGKMAEYKAETIRVYIPMLLRSPRKLVLPSGLKEIEEEAFADSTTFGEVYIPSQTEKIGSRAFAGCSHLVLISIPDSVTEIADDALDGSNNAVILCSIGSEAEAFAKRNGIPYLTTMEISK